MVSQPEPLVANPERMLEMDLLDLGDLQAGPRDREGDQARAGFRHRPVFDPVPAKVPLDEAMGRQPDETDQDPGTQGDEDDGRPRAPGKAPYLDARPGPEV